MNAMNGGDFADLLCKPATLACLDVADKPGLLAALAAHVAPFADVPETLILERVREREALGSTGFGQGAAIPHARISGLAKTMVVLARLATPLDYGALDGEPVDIVVLLLSPEGSAGDHLKALARISRALRNKDILSALRAAADADALHAAIDRPLMAGARAA
jgi:PTS system nitrogen regulatory IIA component